MIVMKFGGTSVQNEEAISKVISIVKTRLKDRPLVVVSAFAKVTRTLCELADEARGKRSDRVKDLVDSLVERHHNVANALLADNRQVLDETLCKVDEVCKYLLEFAQGVCRIGELSSRSEAQIISTGEVLSSIIVSAAMNVHGVKSNWVDARRLIVTNDNYLSAKPDLDTTTANVLRIIPEQMKGADIVLTQGFIASTSAGTTSVLGFEGSDYSAAIFGMALDAERVEIWTDVDGIRTADPRVVTETCRIDKVSYEEAAEMAYLGARVLHPLTIEPARKKNIPIQVLNTMNPENIGSLVLKGDNIGDGVKSVAFRNDIDFIEISSKGLDGVTSMIGKVFGILRECKIEASLVSASESKVSFTLEGGQPGFQTALDKLYAVSDVTLYRDKAQVSLVGRNVVLDKDLVKEILSLSYPVYMMSQGASLMNISFVIDKGNVVDCVNRLHGKIFQL